MLNKFKTSHNLYLLMGVMVLVIILTGVYAIRQMRVLNGITETIYADRVFPMEQLSQVRFLYGMSTVSAVQRVRQQQMTFAEAEEELDQNISKIKKSWKNFTGTHLTPEESELVKETMRTMRNSDSSLSNLRGILRSGDSVALGQYIDKEFYPVIGPTLSKINDLIELQLTVSGEKYKVSQDTFNHASGTFFLFILISLGFAIPFGAFIVRNIKELIVNLKESNFRIVKSEAKCRAFLERAGDAIFILNEGKGIVEVNDSAVQLLGYSREELLQMHISDFVDEREIIMEHNNPPVLMHQARNLSERNLTRKYGGEVLTEINSSSLDGLGYILILRNISERKKLEAELVERKDHMSMFIEHSPASLAMFDTEMRYIAVSRRWVNDYNLGNVELLGKTHYEIFPEVPERWKEIHQRCLKGAIEKSEEDAFIRMDGSKEWMKWEIRPWHKSNGEVGGIIMFTEVITQRKNATELFKYQFLNSPDILLVVNKFHKIETINRTTEGGRPVEELIGEDCRYLLPEESRETGLAAIEKCISEQENQEVELKLKFNIIVRARFVPLITDGSVSHVMIIATDITKKKQTQQKLTESEEKHRALIENISETVILINEEAEVVFQSPSFVRTSGFNLEELKGRNIFEFIHPEDLHGFRIFFQESKNMPGVTIQNQYRILHKNGTYIWVEGNITNLLHNDSVKAYIGIYHDITERKLMEIERQKIINELLQRNRDLEQFAYIVSHNLRAPVANIIGISEYLRDDQIQVEQRQDMGKHLSTSIYKLDGVIKDLNNILQMKREISEKKEIVKLPDLLDDIRLSISNLIQTEKVRFITNFDAVDEMVTLKSYLYSIFYNLISNSIKYKRPNLRPEIEISTLKAGNKIILIFKDNGIGIDLERRRAQVFGLYKRFHTHTEGKGMGLYMVKTQVETLGGTIAVNSKVNEGTEFRIEFEDALT